MKFTRMHCLKRQLVASLYILVSATALADAPHPKHPLLGTWKITLPDGSCSETYIFRPDGTTLVTSAEEVSESEFEVSDSPSEKGFYKMVDKIIKDNGKKDCSGEIMVVGHVATNYLLLHPNKKQFLMCSE